jgi:hypothetical protein
MVAIKDRVTNALNHTSIITGRSAAARLLVLRFGMLPGAWIFVSCVCCVLRR